MKSVFLLVLGLLLVTFGVNALHEFSCNVLNNGGFESDTSQWISFDGNPLQFESSTVLCGNRSIVFTSATSSGSSGAYQVINLASLISSENYQIYEDNSITWHIEGFSKSSNVSTGPLSDYSIYVDYSADGQSRGALAFLPFLSGSNDWQKHITYFTTPASGFLYVYVLFRARTGTAWFDSLNLVYKQPDHNLLTNGGFEYDTDLGDFSSPAISWISATSVVGYTIADITAGIQFSHSLLRSARITIEDGQSMWIQQQITNLNLNNSLPMLVSAWSMADNVVGAAGADYSLYLDVGYSVNGSIVNTTTFIAPYTTGTHDWELRQILVPANPPAIITRIYVNLILRSFEVSRSGTAYFDDVTAYYVDQPTIITV